MAGLFPGQPIPKSVLFNGFIYSPFPGHPFLQEIWSRMHYMLLSRQFKSRHLSPTGPGLFSYVLNDMGSSVISDIHLLEYLS